MFIIYVKVLHSIEYQHHATLDVCKVAFHTTSTFFIFLTPICQNLTKAQMISIPCFTNFNICISPELFAVCMITLEFFLRFSYISTQKVIMWLMFLVFLKPFFLVWAYQAEHIELYSLEILVKTRFFQNFSWMHPGKNCHSCWLRREVAVSIPLFIHTISGPLHFTFLKAN